MLAVFLENWKGGCFAREGGAAMLAAVSARLGAAAGAENQHLQPVIATLCAQPCLQVQDRRFRLHFHAGLAVKLLHREPECFTVALCDWARTSLPRLAPRPGQPYRLSVGIPLPGGRCPSVRVDVEVLYGVAGSPPVSAQWYSLADRQVLEPALRHLLRRALPRLAAKAAARKLLLLELPVRGLEHQTANMLLLVRDDFPLLAQVDWVVIAAAGGKPSFDIWAGASQEWLEHLEVRAVEPASRGVWAQLTEEARCYASASKAPNTVRAYESDWRDFRLWCAGHGASALPAHPETVALYLTDRAGTKKTSSLSRHLTTINRAHQAAGLPSPASMQNAVLSEVWKGIRRTKGTAEEGKKPFLIADLRYMITGLPSGLQGLRDRALLLTGFAGGFRRSELAALRVEDLQQTPEGLVVRLRRSKTDQEAEGRPVALPYGSNPATCPVRTLQQWLAEARITTGPLFRAVDQFGLPSQRSLHADSIGWIVKRAAERAGLSKADYGGHSLRAGLATQAAMNGATEFAIMRQTGHRSLSTVRKYIREGSLFRENAAAKLGL